MELVTIVSDELSEEEKKEVQEEADKLICVNGYTVHSIMHHFGLKRNLCVSLYSDNGNVIMNCRKLHR